ncbi:MAG: hypothetical protein AAF438_13350 [Pseudomonadota bacterium]
MDKALIGVLAVLGVFHLLLIIVPAVNTLKSPISTKSKIAWCAFLILLPLIGVITFHYRFRSSLYTGKPYEPTAHDLGALNSNNFKQDQ